MRGDILGLERRRRWGDKETLEIVQSVGVCDATVTQVAQWLDVTRQQIYAWRHELKKTGLLSALSGGLFLPVVLDNPLELTVPAVFPKIEAVRPSKFELQLANSRCLRFYPGSRRGMIGPGTGVRVYLACGVTDMRKGIERLAALAQDHLRQKPTGGAVFAFRGRKGGRLKLLHWYGQGFCLYYKVLQKRPLT